MIQKEVTHGAPSESSGCGGNAVGATGIDVQNLTPSPATNGRDEATTQNPGADGGQPLQGDGGERPASTGATLNRGRSKQDYSTPWDFVRAVEAKWGPMVADLACTRENAKAPSGYYFDEGVNSLAQSWSQDYPIGNLWLNPPFANIGVWAEKCAWHGVRRDGLIFLLTPASIGTDWFAARVWGNARVLGISPRITFDGTTDPYPKDLMLSIFGKATDGFGLWRWK